MAQREKALQLEPTNVDYLLSLATSRSNLAFSRYYRKYDDAPNIPENRAIADKILGLPNITRWQKVKCYNLYAGSYNSIEATMPWYQKSVAVTPYAASVYNNRGGLYEDNGDMGLAAADRARARKLTDAWNAQMKAWQLATSSNAAVRNGAQAIQLAEQACRVTDHREPTYLRTLAATHAEAGNFEEAVRWATEAMRLADDAEKSDIATELRSYRNQKPWRG